MVGQSDVDLCSELTLHSFGGRGHPGLEQIIETSYQFLLYIWRVTFDYQFIENPGYNRDRGPVSGFGTRLHMQF